MEPEGDSPIRLEFRHRVPQGDIDRVLRSSKLHLKDGWLPHSGDGALLVDLSRVEFIDFAAAARILVLAEGAARRGWRVLVSPPCRARRPSEDQFLAANRAHPRVAYFQQGVSEQVQRRRRAHGFLRHTGFYDALAMPHLASAFVCPSLVPSDQSSSRSEDDPPMTPPAAPADSVGVHHDTPPPTIVRFRWISQLAQDAEWHKDVVALLSAQLTKTDSESLVQHVVSELIDNVREHAAEEGALAPPWALVGAMIFNSRGARYLPRPEMFYPAADHYIRWLKEQTTPVVRLLVADSGRGLTATIEQDFSSRSGHRSAVAGLERNHAIALYAFNAGASRFGSAAGRGVGLPAVRRFVRSYRGAITVRAANISSGYACRRGRLEELANPPLAYAPGTAIEVLLGLGLGARARQDERTSEGVESVTLLPIEARAPELEAVLQRADEAISASSPQHPIVLLTLHDWPRDRRTAFSTSIVVSELANDLAGRAGLAVFLPELPASEVDSAFGAADEVRERHDPAALAGFRIPQRSVPFLVLPSSGREYWLGGTPALRKILYDMSEGAALDDGDVHGSTEDLDYLRTERDWLAAVPGGLRLRLQPGQVDRQIGESLSADLARRIGLPSAGSAPPAASESAGLTQFLLPSGIRAVAQLDWAHLSGDRCLPERIAYVLARRLTKIVRDPARAQIVYSERVPLRLASALTVALGALPQVQPLRGESISFNYGDYSPFEAGQRVVLLVGPNGR